MGTFKIRKVVLRSMFNKPATLMYPVIPKEWKENTRGHIEIDVDNCILCGMCMRKCPTNAITVDRAGASWEIQRMQCIQCGHCAEVCPKKCLTVKPEYTEPGTEKVIDKFDIPQQKKPAAPAEEKPAEAAKPAEEVKEEAPVEEVKEEAPAEAAGETGVVCDKGSCILCGACAGACPVGAIAVDGDWTIDRGTCVKCGACIGSCPVGALEMGPVE